MDSPFDIDGMNAELEALGVNLNKSTSAVDDDLGIDVEGQSLGTSLLDLDDAEGVVVEAQGSVAAGTGGDTDNDDDDDFEDLENYLANLDV